MKGGQGARPTRRQHTVWRKYLRAWAANEKIWCAMAGKRFSSDLMNVGQERDFYRVLDMTDEDIAIVRAAVIAPMANEIQRKSAERWLIDFDRLRIIRKQLGSAGIDAESALEPVRIQAEEMLHGEIERNALPLLERLLVSDNFCLDEDDDYIVFVHYLRRPPAFE